MMGRTAFDSAVSAAAAGRGVPLFSSMAGTQGQSGKGSPVQWGRSKCWDTGRGPGTEETKASSLWAGVGVTQRKKLGFSKPGSLEEEMGL